MEFNTRVPAFEMNRKGKTVYQKKRTFSRFLKSAESQMTRLLLIVCSMTAPSTANTITKVGLWAWNLEVTVCCRAESRTSSDFSVWSAELTEIIWWGSTDRCPRPKSCSLTEEKLVPLVGCQEVYPAWKSCFSNLKGSSRSSLEI